MLYLQFHCPLCLQHKKNLHLKFSEDPCKPVKQAVHTRDIESDEYNTPTFSPLMMDDLIGHTFLTTPLEDGQHFHACIICCIEEINETTYTVHTEFLICKSDDEVDKIMGYHEL